MVSNDRGQAHALEAITAGMLLLASVLFALQVTAVTPLTGSTSSQHIENQQARLAEGVLAAEAENGTVVPTVLYWNESESQFHGAADDGYHSGGPPTAFGTVLNQTLRDRNIAFDVNVFYVRENGQRERHSMVDLGSPSDHASTATRSFTLYDDDRIRYENGSAGPPLENASYFAPDVGPDSRLYNVVELEVVVWRM
ncbi:DUF7288 family protein [Halolamina salifodinae]|uniref:DUF7288 family protein n=1 Tax=Halolamina salifodinae TaxID=1202767 RepID=UPI001AE2A11C|nr:hypothetical protein [Halolamina salifodinae]